jgi:3-hydroxybutyrate dehydrogenase
MSTTVFVTGGGRGIGRAIAEAFAATGASVVVVARTLDQVASVARGIERRGREALAVSCDVRLPEAVAAAVNQARARFGEIDVLVNNAGMARSEPFGRTDEALWSETLAVNLTGTFLCTRAVLPAMLTRRSGRVINVASIAGRVGFPYTTAYCAAKHGVLGLTRALALEVATSGVTVNAICPGWVDTEMTAASIARIVEKTHRTPAEARATLEAMNPQRRLVTSEEVAAMAVYLASDAAAGITGQAFNIDGGEVMA